MATTVREVMTSNPITLEATTPILEAARAMREKDVGSVVVQNGGKICGIVTDRDITVRAVAQGRGPDTPLQEICSGDVVTVKPDDSLDDAIRLMRDKALRRLPVTSDGTAVGIVSIGDLAQERDPKSVLAGISQAPANH